MTGKIKSLNILIFIFYRQQKTDFKIDSGQLFEFGVKQKENYSRNLS